MRTFHGLERSRVVRSPSATTLAQTRRNAAQGQWGNEDVGRYALAACVRPLPTGVRCGSPIRAVNAIARGVRSDAAVYGCRATFVYLVYLVYVF